jgi:hypothetical protein
MLLVLLGLAILVIVGERVLSFWLEKRLDGWAQEQNVAIGSISVSVAARSVRARDVRWPSDTQPHAKHDSASVHLERLTVTGIELIPLLRSKELKVGAVVAENGDIVIPAIEEAKENPKDSTTAFGGFRAEKLRLVDTSVTYRSDSATTWTARTTIALSQLTLQDKAKPLRLSSYHVDDANLSLTNLKRTQENGFYSLLISHIEFDRLAKTISCDSLSLLPAHPKLVHAHKRGTQSTWAAVLVPVINVRGIDLKVHADSTLTASHILLQDIHVDAFRDRRVPFRRKNEVPLPMKWLRELPMAIEVDSLQVKNMEIVYEHISENGFEPGKLRFTQLEGLFANINNRGYANLPRTTTLSASALVMGGAKLEAQFTFPLDANTPYTAKGKMGNFQLRALNPMLENAAFVSVESGLLNELAFQFQYNNEVSRGELNIDYSDLRVQGLQKGHDGDVNAVKTLVANVALKNTNNTSGVIEAERDKRRFIFHYWAMSLMDGIRNAVAPAAPDRSK